MPTDAPVWEDTIAADIPSWEDTFAAEPFQYEPEPTPDLDLLRWRDEMEKRRLAWTAEHPPSLRPIAPGQTPPWEVPPIQPPATMAPSFPPIEGPDLAAQEKAAKEAGKIEPPPIATEESLVPFLSKAAEYFPEGSTYRIPGLGIDFSTEPAAAIGKLTLGIANYITSLRGLTEAGVAVSPYAPAVYLKWAKDMIEMGLVSSKDLLDAWEKGDTKRISQDIINGVVGLTGGGKLGYHGLKRVAGEVPTTGLMEPEPSPLAESLANRIREADFLAPSQPVMNLVMPSGASGLGPLTVPEGLETQLRREIGDFKGGVVPPAVDLAELHRIPREPRVVVPGGPGTPSDFRVQVIRDRNMLTVDEVRNAFGIQSREEARALLWEAVPELRPPVGPARPEFTVRPPTRPPGTAETPGFQQVEVTRPAEAAPAGQVPLFDDTEPVAPKPAAEPVKPVVPAVNTETTPSKLRYPPREVPADQIATRPDLMQFKQMDEATGENAGEKLTGTWDELKAGTLLLWEPKNPAEHGLTGNQRYIVANGHHRFAFGQREGVAAYGAQILREADGISAQDARRIAAEANIADGKGTIYDQAKFLRNSAAARSPDEEMGARSRLGARGRQGATIAFDASDDVFAAFVNERIDPRQAESIASAAPKNPAAQRIGLKFALDGKSPDFVSNVIKASLVEAGPKATELDLFGQDDSAMKRMAEQAQRAAAEQKKLRDQIQAISGPVKRGEIAKQLGIDIKDPAALEAKLKELRTELSRWENWPLNPDLVARVRGEPAPASPPPVKELWQMTAVEARKTFPSLSQEKWDAAVTAAWKDGRLTEDSAPVQSMRRSKPSDFGEIDAVLNGRMSPSEGLLQRHPELKSEKPAEPPQPPASPPAPEVKKPFFKPEEQARVDELLAKLKNKLQPPPSGMQERMAGAPIDPELFTLGGELAYHYIKAGVRKFGDFATHMVRDLGERAKDYLLSWYSNAKLQLTDIAHELDSEETASRIFQERFGPAGVAGGGEVPGRVRGGGGVGGRPGIRIARKELIPVPRQHVGADSYAARSGFRLDDEQVNGINLILDRFLSAPKGAFVLADGTGFGKTAQMLAVADQYIKRGLGKAVLVVTQNKQVVEGRFKADAERMGIDPNILTITTYTSLKKLPRQPWDLVIYDEAHNLKNAEAKKSIAAAMLEPKHALFGTATPMDRPTGAAYFLAQITGKSELEIAHALGYELVDRIDPLTQKPYQAPVLLPGFSWAKVWQNIMSYRDAAVKSGSMIRREYPFYGKVETTTVSMTPEARAEHDALVDFFDERIKATRNPNAKRNWAGQKTNALGRWAEQQKLDEAVRLTKEHLAKGGQVVIVAETDKRQFMRVEIKGSVPGVHPTSGNEGFFVDGAVTQIEAMLKAAGITDISHIHDPTKYDIAQNVRDFQSGKNRVALATPASGGTGIDLDDAVGNKPRLMVALSKSFAGDQFEQLIGRVSRKNTKSPSAVNFVELEGSFGDERRNDILDKKIKTLKAIQGGEDLDVAGGFETKGVKPSAEPEAGFTAPELEEMPSPAEVAEAPPSDSPSTQEELNRTGNAKAPGLFGSIVDGLLSGLLPSAISGKHLEAAERLGSKLGVRNRRAESSAHVLKPFGRLFDKLGVFREDLAPADNPGLRFMSAISMGRELTGRLKEASDLIDHLFQQRILALQEAGAPLKTIRENYFPGIWTRESRLAFNAAMDKARAEGIIGKDFDINNATPDQKAYVKNLTDEYIKQGIGSENDSLVYLARRPMGGRESFRKQKVFEDIMDGAEFGLRPVSYNPIDLINLKLAEMDRNLLLHEHAMDLRSTGENVFINPYKKIPDGWMIHPDKKYGTVYGPPTTKLEEFVDKMTYDGLMEVAKKLGLKVERRYSAGRGRLGFASTTGQTVTQFATELSVLAHEIGHQLDFKYGLWDRIAKGEKPSAKTPTQAELRALADLSWQGRAEEDVSASYKRKVRAQAEKMAHLLEAYITAKDAFQGVAPTVYRDFDNFIRSRPELKSLADIRPGISLERLASEKYVGLPIMGYRIVPVEHGLIIKNYLSSSLYNSPMVGKLYKGWMGLANLLNQSQLGMGSGFHAGFTTGEAQMSNNALVWRDIYGVLRGNRSIADLGRTVGKAAIAVVRNPVIGNKVLNAWRDPDGTIDPRIAQVVRAAELGGGGFKLETGLRTQQTVKMLRDWYSEKRIRAAARSPVAFVELLAKPVMELIVPRQKAGVFADLAWRIIEQNPGKSLEELTPQFRQAWNRNDARLGQVQYQRMFMDNYVKNFVQATVRAPGWSGGTIAEIGGGFVDAARFMREFYETGKLPQELPDRTAYVLALVSSTMLVNGALTYMFTGTMPQGLDFFAFRDGTKDERGRAGRLMLPTYMKDILAYARHPGETLLHKSHPILSLISDVIRNKDYYGVEVRSRDAGAGKQALETVEYVAKAFEPFWTRGMRREVQRKGGPAKATLPLVGIMPAPRAVTETTAERMAHDFMLERIPVGARTKEQAARSEAKYKAEPPTEPYLVRTVRRLDAASAVRVFEHASREEQKRIYYDILEKIDRNKTLSEDELRDLERRLNAARKR